MAPDAPERSQPTTDPTLASVLREYMTVTERLQQTHELLQNEVMRLREELAHKNQELERRRRLAALGELAAGVAHEVRNPLGAIQLYSGLLRKHCSDASGAIDLIGKIEAGISAIEGVVQDTLALAPRAAQLEPQPLAPVLEQALQLAAAKLGEHQVRLRVRASRVAVAVFTEPAGLQRVVLNLLINAAEASAPGRAVLLDVRAGEGEVLIRVADHGPGLQADVIDRIFDPFFTTKASGTGLGLTIAHRLIEAHGGRLEARNRTGGGAVFTIVLPAEISASAAATRVARRRVTAA